MLFLNRNLNLMGDHANKTINFFNGEQQEIESDDFQALWVLLELLAEGVTDANDEKISDWMKIYGYSKEETNEIIEFLKSYNLIINYNSMSENKIDTRNKRFFSIYKNEPNEFMDKLREQTVMIFGVGTIGSTLALTLAKMGIGKLILVDDDLIEIKNLNSQVVYSIKDIGLDKATVLKVKIEEACPEVEVCVMKQMVDESFTSSLQHTVIEHSVKFGVSCFDTGTSKIHTEILKTLQENNASYILTGYSKDTTVVKLLDQDNSLNEIDELFNEYPRSYFLGINQGTILHSYASSLLILNLILNKSELFNKQRFLKTLELNITNIMPLKAEVSELENSQEKFFQSLSVIFDMSLVKSRLDYIENELKKINPLAENKELESEILSFYHYFKLLDFSEKPILEGEKERFEQMFHLLEDQSESMDSKIPDMYSTDNYIDFVDNLEIEGMKIHHALTVINNEPNPHRRTEIQSRIFETLAANSDFLTKCLYYHKQDLIDQDYENKDMYEVSGLTLENIQTFERIFGEGFERKLLNIFTLLFPRDENNTTFDYLYNVNSNNMISMSMNEAIDFQKEIFIREHAHSSFGIKILSHLNKLIHNNQILDQSNSNVYTTLYFPSINESRIVIDYFESIVVMQNLVHEIGHSYYNQFYTDSFYEKSQQVINETLASLYETIFHVTLFKDKQVKPELKSAFAYHYLHRLNKMVTSPFSLFHLENNIIDHIKQYSHLSFESLIQIRKDTKEELFPNMQFENEKNSYANIFLNPSFVTEYKEGITSGIATTLAIFLFDSFGGNVDALEDRIKEFLKNPDKGIDNFCKCILSRKYDDDLVLDLSKSFDAHVTGIGNFLLPLDGNKSFHNF